MSKGVKVQFKVCKLLYKLKSGNSTNCLQYKFTVVTSENDIFQYYIKIKK